jgi:polyphosphate kinase 2
VDELASFVAQYGAKGLATIALRTEGLRSSLSRFFSEKELLALQIELLKVQRWAADTGQRIVIIFEGRDTAGKGGSIKRFVEHLNPRHVKLIALSKPSEIERGQWYFQRYIAHLPTAGEITLFDRSWYNRAGVEPVMGFCTERETAEFHIEAPRFEEMLVRDGILLFKYWLTIGREMQIKRLYARHHDPLKTWKLSPIDLAAPEKWDDYTSAVNDMMLHTHSAITPWTVVRANDKKRTRLAVIRHFLSRVDYADKDETVVGKVDTSIVLSGEDFAREI